MPLLLYDERFAEGSKGDVQAVLRMICTDELVPASPTLLETAAGESRSDGSH